MHAAALFCHRPNLRCHLAFQTIRLFLSQLKHKVSREALDITLDLPVHLRRFHLIQLCQITVKYDLFAPYDTNTALYMFTRQ